MCRIFTITETSCHQPADDDCDALRTESHDVGAKCRRKCDRGHYNWHRGWAAQSCWHIRRHSTQGMSEMISGAYKHTRRENNIWCKCINNFQPGVVIYLPSFVINSLRCESWQTLINHMALLADAVFVIIEDLLHRSRFDAVITTMHQLRAIAEYGLIPMLCIMFDSTLPEQTFRSRLCSILRCVHIPLLLWAHAKHTHSR